MNRGHIPGYYFDEEKKKYFKIQANHIAPENAKYNKTNAKLELRENKKRKRLEKYQQQVVQKQTVVRPKLLRHPLLSETGLQRELGRRHCHAQGDAAFVHGLEAKQTEIEIRGFAPEATILTDAHLLNNVSQMLVAVRHGVASHAMYILHCDGEWGPKKTYPTKQAIHAFHEPITSLHYMSDPAHWNEASFGVVMANTAQPNRFSGNFFWSFISDIGSDDDLSEDRLEAVVLNYGSDTDTIWDCQLDEINTYFALGGTFGAIVRGISGPGTDSAVLDAEDSGEVFSLDWLDRKTIALGMKPFCESEGYHNVALWDIRNKGVAQRIRRRDKISGVRNPDASRHNLVVTSSHDINLYDLRYVSKSVPLMSIEHKSGSPTFHMSILDGDLLATTDWNNKLQVYSLRSGTLVRTLAPYGNRRGIISKPRWQHDFRGVPYLQACVGNTIQRWT
ncbi:hypothetical protein M409DRAFT_24581 [Zasmidium cellare ATCC 36951]|uniref:Uncharacterized protein n=1 Tax=Zasmidium cellare ATCC 36951 TaxID=1080233 RepID=A0A6A6CDA9_ZASCE|nr:uncharacterized protein M409DRAFT_24581 [Zasmidium cellare ATCC 36951]KAF2165197.1 hypothetical protein M409DRAFT_24581 [Zasmidium cellare ATCC 36951]